jgi:transcriptional regulator with XRE-family HTH domain
VSGRNSFSELRAKIDADPERRARMDEKRKAYDVLLRLSELSELRRERGLTQAELAEASSVSQPAISKLEVASSRGGVSGSDMLLTMLAGYIEAPRRLLGATRHLSRPPRGEDRRTRGSNFCFTGYGRRPRLDRPRVQEKISSIASTVWFPMPGMTWL